MTAIAAPRPLNAAELCDVLAEAGNGAGDGVLHDVLLADRHGNVLITRCDSQLAFAVRCFGDEVDFRIAIAAFQISAQAYRDGLVDLVAPDVLVANDNGQPLIRLTHALQAEALLAA